MNPNSPQNDCLDHDQSYNSNCFGCSPRNKKGLKLIFEKSDNEAHARVKLTPDYESYPGVIHGGIITLILDEVMGRAALWKSGYFVLTSSLRTRFVMPMLTNREYRCQARVTQIQDDQLKIFGEIIDRDGRPVATANGFFIAMTEDRSKHGIHGVNTEVSAKIMELGRKEIQI